MIATTVKLVFGIMYLLGLNIVFLTLLKLSTINNKE